MKEKPWSGDASDGRWPRPVGRRILLAGASGGLGRALLEGLAERGLWVGAHFHRQKKALQAWQRKAGERGQRTRLFQADLRHQTACHRLVDDFAAWAGGIDALVQLTGDIERPAAWDRVSEKDWNVDLATNLGGPFFLAQRAMKHMARAGGRIVLTSTASARHGGGATTLAYGVAKAGVECLIKGLARVGAPRKILVNGVAPGFILTPFHTRRLKRTPADLLRRSRECLLKRAGKPDDVARLILYFLSAGGNYVTGECFSVSGGDWL